MHTHSNKESALEEIRSFIINFGIKQWHLANIIGMNQSSFCAKLSKKYPDSTFTEEELVLLKNAIKEIGNRAHSISV